jgi:hypothetical protein
MTDNGGTPAYLHYASRVSAGLVSLVDDFVKNLGYSDKESSVTPPFSWCRHQVRVFWVTAPPRTKRAVIETIFCCLGLISIALFLRSVWVLFLCGITAPLFLLQSPQSSNLSSRLFSSFARLFRLPFDESQDLAANAHRRQMEMMEVLDTPMRGSGESVSIALWQGILSLCSLVTIPIILLVSLIMRYGTTILYLWPGIKKIPQNWRALALDTSIFDDVWIIPNHYTIIDLFDAVGLSENFMGPRTTRRALISGFCCLVYFALSYLLVNIDYFEGGALRTAIGFGCVIVGYWFVLWLLIIVVTIFPKLLRISLKASSIVWAPLIFSVDTPIVMGNNLTNELVQYYQTSWIARLSMLYAYMMGILATVAIGFLFLLFSVTPQSLPPRLTIPISIFTVLSIFNTLISIVIWNVILPIAERNAIGRIKDNSWAYLVNAKFIQGLISMATIPASMLSLCPNSERVLNVIIHLYHTIRIIY